MREQYGKYNDEQLFNTLKGEKKEAEAAFAELYSRYSQRVYAYVLRIMGNSDESNDIFQETFIKLFNSVNKVKKMDNFPAYVMKIARNLCLNYKRSKRTPLNIEDFNLYTNDRGLEQKELLQVIARALECLDFDYREAFVLRQYHGLSYSEIALITEAPESTVKNRVWRAKEKIKHIIQPYLEEISK